MPRLLFVLVCLLLTACGGSATTATKAVTADTIVAAFKAAGLEAENTSKMTREDFAAAPFVCEATRFVIPSLGKLATGQDKGGRIFICPNAADRDRIATYYREIGKSSAALYSHVFVKGNNVVQINGELPDTTAKRYEEALSAIK